MEFIETMEDLLGQSLGPYQISRLLGRGGMAVVYLAQDTRYGYTVALKVLPPYFRHDPAFAKRFRREVEAARVLMHPNIVRVYEAGEERGYLYMAMEYLDDGSLQQRLEAGRPLDLAVVSAVVAQVGSALDFAHARGIVHRDVKPGNILFARDGRIVLSDFGIAKLRWESSLTGSGEIPGTTPYLSPEQIEGQAASTLSDLWALGVVLYQMSTGRLPFTGENSTIILYAIVHKPTPSPSLINLALPPGVEPVSLRALAKEPQARFQSGAEMATALRQAITPRPQPLPVRETPTTLAPPPGPMPVARLRPSPPKVPGMLQLLPWRYITVLVGSVLIVLLCIVSIVSLQRMFSAIPGAKPTVARPLTQPVVTTTPAPPTATRPLTQPVVTRTPAAPTLLYGIVITALPLNVRAGPGLEYDIVGRLRQGDRVTILGEAKAGDGSIWYKIDWPEGAAYILSGYVMTTPWPPTVTLVPTPGRGTPTWTATAPRPTTPTATFTPIPIVPPPTATNMPTSGPGPQPTPTQTSALPPTATPTKPLPPPPTATPTKPT